MVLKYLSLFSGIGAFETALKRIGIGYDLVGYSEVDDYAPKAYSILHGGVNLGDVRTIDNVGGGCDLLTYGFPCQSISQNGKKAGIAVGTRSGLVFDALRVIEKNNPTVCICENVKNLVGKQFKDSFDEILYLLSEIGYNNYWKVMNAVDYGLPQNRERVFVVSVRKDVDNGFSFPDGYGCSLCLGDIMDVGVGGKYLAARSERAVSLERKWANDNDIHSKECTVIRLGNIYGDGYGTGYAGWVYGTWGIGPTLQTAQGGGRTPMVMDSGRLRKLTPRECFALMGFLKEDCDLLSLHGLSDSRLYKMAGNSICVNILVEIFKCLLKRRYI